MSQSGKLDSKTMEMQDFGLIGLGNLIGARTPAARDRATLALGTDLNMMGLDIQSPGNLYSTFGSPWEETSTSRFPTYTTPESYMLPHTMPKAAHFQKMEDSTLFYIFYGIPRDVLQIFATQELYRRNWVYHKQHKLVHRAAVEIRTAPGLVF